MGFVPVESSMITAVAYDDVLRELRVIFKSGQTYVYRDVPRETYDGLLAADSKGSYMNAHVMDQFDSQRQVSHRKKGAGR